MFASVLSAAIYGMEVREIQVEADVSDGLPSFAMVGFPSAQVREAQERVRTAFKNNRLCLPPKKVTVNFAPADMKKEGAGFDLPVAAAVLAAAGILEPDLLEGVMIVGEISLNGELHGVAGVLPRVIRARELGLRFCVIPEENIREGNLVKDMPVFGVKSLNDMIRCLRDPNTYTTAYQEKEKTENKPEIPKVDFADICGQEGARRAAEIAVSGFSVKFAMQYVSKFSTLGTVKMEKVFNMKTMKSEFNDYDNSFTILLFSLFSFVVWFAAAVVWFKNVINAYTLQKMEEAGKHINTFKEDLRSLTEEKFHITLLTLPVLGVVIFTLIPILLLIFVAFTNYDQQHMPPTELFSWVGFSNFISLFGGGGLTSTFGYAFVRVLGWTLVWAFFATFTTYIGGILLSLLLNSKKTSLPKMWRTLFIVTIAVPQFVSLLLVR